MNGSERARNVLRWLDYANPPRIEIARKSCRGRKDVKRLRANLRRLRWPEAQVSVMCEAAAKRDLQFMLCYEFLVAG
jgi:hypothetical protein